MANSRIDMTKPFAVVRKGGSIGEQSSHTKIKGYPVVATFDTQIEAHKFAKKRNAGLSPGEKSHYRISYLTVPVPGIREDTSFEEYLILEEKKVIKSSNHGYTQGQKVKVEREDVIHVPKRIIPDVFLTVKIDDKKDKDKIYFYLDKKRIIRLGKVPNNAFVGKKVNPDFKKFYTLEYLSVAENIWRVATSSATVSEPHPTSNVKPSLSFGFLEKALTAHEESVWTGKDKEWFIKREKERAKERKERKERREKMDKGEL